MQDDDGETMGRGPETPAVLSPAPGPGGRRPALLIGAGAAVAAVAVVGALLLWPDDRSMGDATTRLPAVPTTTAAPPPTASAPATERQRPASRRTTERPDGPSSVGRPPVVVPPVPPKPPTPTSSPTPTPTSTVVPLPPAR